MAAQVLRARLESTIGGVASPASWVCNLCGMPQVLPACRGRRLFADVFLPALSATAPYAPVQRFGIKNPRHLSTLRKHLRTPHTLFHDTDHCPASDPI